VYGGNGEGKGKKWKGRRVAAVEMKGGRTDEWTLAKFETDRRPYSIANTTAPC